MQASDKEKVVGHAPAAPQESLFETSTGMPLFWQERKTAKCWQKLLNGVHAKCIVD